MVDTARARRLGEAIAQIVAEMLERRIKDPRLGFVTVTEARVTGDLREATVFYTVYGSDEERADVGRGAGQRDRPDPVRGRQADRPEAHAVDHLRAGHRAGHGRNIEELVARARVADAAVAAAREGAMPAGDPDPYRVRAEPTTTMTDADAEGGGPAARTRCTAPGRRVGPRGCTRPPGVPASGRAEPASGRADLARSGLGDYPAAGDGRARYSRS